jgi:glycosyltransferase involved in cell wall biosynthesis
VGAFPDLIKNHQNGFIAPVEDINSFQQKIKKWIALGADLRGEMSEQAYETIRRGFNADHEIRNMMSVYQFLHERERYKKFK